LDGLAAAHASKIEAAWRAAGSPDDVRLLFSAHGLPEKVVQGGDPYQAQVEATSAAVAKRLAGPTDWKISYQSRVGPMKWLGPATDAAIVEASREGLALVVVPIAFVSEHIETLVELDHEYAALAKANGCPAYIRVPALGVEEAFIGSLAKIAVEALQRGGGTCPGSPYGCRGWSKCPRTERAA
jgi:ferrochelatase